MENQVRRYRIAEGKMDEFVAGWRDFVVPLRQQFGFVVQGAWVLESTNEFVWVLGHEGEEGFAAANEAYYSSDAREAMQPDPARLIEEVEETLARSVI